MVSSETKKITLTSGQVRAARALLRWSASELAKTAGVGLATVKRAEAVEGPLMRTIPATAAALKSALEAGGVEFIPENGGGPGVRLTHPAG